MSHQVTVRAQVLGLGLDCADLALELKHLLGEEHDLVSADSLYRLR